MKKLFIASDHAGLQLKTYLIQSNNDIDWQDLGPFDEASVDYPDFADVLAKKIKVDGEMGVLICGSGQGMAMRANKFSHIRAALVWDLVSARLSRQHNNSNVLCLGGRLLPFGLAQDIFKVFINTEFEGGRHLARVNKISQPSQ